MYPHYPAASEEGRGDLRKRSHEQQRQQVLQAVYDFAWNSEGGDGKYRHVKLSQKCGQRLSDSRNLLRSFLDHWVH